MPNGNGMMVGRGLFGWILFAAIIIMLFVMMQRSNQKFQTIAFERIP